MNSVVGKQIQDSDVGNLNRKYIDTDGKIANVDVNAFQQGDTLIMPVVVTKAPALISEVDEVENLLKVKLVQLIKCLQYAELKNL